MGFLMKWCGGWATYGMARGLRADGYKDDMYSTRIMGSFVNGVFYGWFFFIPMIRLTNRIQIHLEKKDPTKYPDAYQELMMTNRNVIL